MNQKMLDILESHEKFMLDKWGDNLLLQSGPGHIVYGDYNLDDSSIEFCLNWAEVTPLSKYAVFDHNCLWEESDKQEIINDTMELLERLLEIPEEERYVWEEEDFG